MDLPLAQNALYILMVLSTADQHGYAIMKEVEEISDGVVSLGPSTLYRVLRQLLESGLIVEVAGDDEDSRRRTYQLTGAGHHLLAQEVDRLRRLLSVYRPAEGIA